MGVVTMSGMLMVSLGEPINIWLPLLLFALLPLLLSFVTAALQWQQPGTGSWQAGGVAPGVIPRLVLRLLHVEDQAHDHAHDQTGELKHESHASRQQTDRQWQAYRESPRLISPWLQWQLQRAGSLFMLFAMLTFFVVATFQDIRFVWSSTFIQQATTMTAVFEVIALPWSWLLAAPSLEVVQASHLSQLGHSLSTEVPTSVSASIAASVPASTATPTGAAAETLWPFVVMTILFYGLLPRVLLLLLFRQQVRTRLEASICESGRVEAFLNGQQQEASEHALEVEQADAPLEEQLIDADTNSRIGWRLMDESWSLNRNLGLGDWQEDERWLASDDSVLPQPVQVLVAFWQTPTGEFEDCLQLLRQNNSDVSLLLLKPDNSADNSADKSADDASGNAREAAQLRTWQYFAEKCHISMMTGRSL